MLILGISIVVVSILVVLLATRTMTDALDAFMNIGAWKEGREERRGSHRASVILIIAMVCASIGAAITGYNL